MLKRLELSGFKSFAKKAVVDFPSPITSIVGPNGSGKSNIVEAIRFVLGEQSIKSMRGREGKDLIWNGSKVLPKASRASVSLVLDNSKKVFSIGEGEGKIDLNFDEISITREVFGDGKNKYSINGSETRLKDIYDLLSNVHIGASAHHIISQGEADALLRSNIKDRRALLEDSLGLTIYHSRIKDAERKLEKTNFNLKEARSLRREIAPHLNFLKKQVEKVEKADEIRFELVDALGSYIKDEDFLIKDTTKQLTDNIERVELRKKEIQEQIKNFEKKEKIFTVNNNEDIKQKEEKIKELRKHLEEVALARGRIEGAMSLLSGEEEKSSHITFNRSWYVENIKNSLEKIKLAIKEDNFEILRAELLDVKDILENMLSSVFGGDKKETENKKEELSLKLNNFEKQYNILSQELSSTQKEFEDISRVDFRSADKIREEERNRMELILLEERLNHKLESLHTNISIFKQRSVRLGEDMKEAIALLGHSFRVKESHTEGIDDTQQEQRRKKIERLKIKLEEIGVVGAQDVMREFQETSERDTFLAREIEDLEKSVATLSDTIFNLKKHLEDEFKEGIEKINKVFGDFFATMFGGGSAFLSIAFYTRKRKSDEENQEDETETEEGVEINVNLPRKKTKDLALLSGGERSLVSIALLFAISQVNPPPFLVLDETDAALDEANSRKYGDMIEKLAETSQLVIVTHNRETMSRAHVLYGVTIGSDGGSKLLSVKFDEAVAIAK